ncbi:MAG: hypothetical protein A2294_00240 [Candidatus Magasanikbacteria bacterium RIFOXYB2_FULL_38_10]|nr:MAG: hypothetical protein A2294_00240 [Candidatus Magasanikbacteria bacterium RIFOXYB2_FULL_38_10]
MFKRLVFLGLFALILSLILPLGFNQNDNFKTSAADELRLTKGAQVKHPALGGDFVVWIEYREGAYNLYFYNFTTKKESQLNKNFPLSFDAVGPVVYQNYVYLADHAAEGWNIWEFDIDRNLSRKLIKEDKAVQSLSAYEKYVTYEVKNDNTTDVFLLNKNSVSVEEMVKNITNDESYQKSPVIFGSLIAWGEFSVCKTEDVGCDPFKYGRVITYDILSGVKKIIKDNVASLSPVQINNWALSWSELEGSTKVVKVYGYTTGTGFNVSPSDYHSYNPIMFSDSLVYFVSRSAGEDLELFQFSTGKHTILSWSKAIKKEPTLGSSNRFVSWIDNRLGTDDLYYFDSQAEDPKAVSQASEDIIDQDNDGLRDSLEFTLGTNPFVLDTDNDGLADNEEVIRYHTYPTQYDSDGDGIKDGEEINNWLSDPLKFDSNNDGIDDKTSIVQGYNPMANRAKLTVYRTIKMEDPAQEKAEVSYLKRALNNYLGYGRWFVKNQTEWNNISNAYSYGGYNIKEIGAYLRGDKSAISFDTLATVWREQQELNKLASN